MGNCCRRYAEDEDSEENPSERSSMYSEENPSERSSMHSDENPRERLSSKTSSDLCVGRRLTSLNRGEGCRVNDHELDSNDGRRLLIDNQAINSSLPMHATNFENKSERTEYTIRGHHPGLGRIPKAREGEQVSAGWPSWLAEEAGEAIKGWVPRKEDSFQILDKIGEGTYSTVYRARDLEQRKIVALKKVKFDIFDPDSIRFMAREIHILRRLHHPNIIKLEGLITSRMSCTLYLVMEYMEHDLVGLASRSGLKFTEPQIKCYIKQLFYGLEYCHRRGILHRDIKGSNLLIDNNGILKIADFGLANFYHPHQVQPLTSRVVTLWYRPPELLLGATCYGSAIDLWSTGCILAELYAGKPILPGRTEVEQLHKIFKLCGSPSEDYWRNSQLPHATAFKPQQPYRRSLAETFKDFPAPALALIETLLSIDPYARRSAAHALNSEFFSSEPLPCEPAELPNYPPSKELDPKVQDEDVRRQAAGGSKGNMYDVEGEGTTESLAFSAVDANAELFLSMQKSGCLYNSRSEKFNPYQKQAAFGFPVELPRPEAGDKDISGPQGTLHKRAGHYGPLVHQAVRANVGKNMDDAPKISTGAYLSTMSSFAGPKRSLIYEDCREKYGSSQLEVPKAIGRFPGSFNEAYDSMRKQDGNRHNQSIAGFANRDVRNSYKDPVLLGYGSRPRGSNIHYSGTLLAPTSKVGQMLKDHDRQVQEEVRRARGDKGKQIRVQAEAISLPTNALFVGP